ncbi:cell division protein ZapA [Thioclava sp. BHET1]|uniref:Cell division protein ZapA n=1 Tax=Thioclava dalianensis TaxID=1185766 RepID=A0A074TIS5_9RHOB|nr:cell division protein ZapA [Thioclava dalianensis]KEP71616.1 cell division protein ZapA [Thioclava dalianensis]TMV87784.1 cell division protein ZapA [Thioclava sp. BHET1]SFN43083.1 cell division protein ZapA [Thioclava dalianensis]
MPEVTITIGQRDFQVACQEGEEHFLRTAAAMLDSEAQVLLGQIGRLPEARMLLMSGLMLADKAAGLEDQLRAAQDRAGELQAQLDDLQSNPARVEVPVVPVEVAESLAEIAARTEALADRVEEQA